MSNARRNRNSSMLVWQLLLGIAGLLTWQGLVTAGILDKFFFSRPSEILARVWQWALSGSIWMHLAITLTEAALSFAIGVALGIVLGFLLARVNWLATLLDPYIRIANALPRVVLAADTHGHFVSDGAINGNPIRFLVDTGATSVALPASDADRLGIDYRKGRRGISNTAGGPVTVYRVSLDSVRLGGIELRTVDAVVIEQGLDIALLGMSFLNRVEMMRDGATMTLIRRF